MKITIIRNENNVVIYKIDYKNYNRKTKFVDINKFYLSEPNILYILKSDSNNKITQYIIENYKKKDNSMRNIVFFVLSLLGIAIILPIALGLISNTANVDNLSEVIDPSIITLLTVLIPIIAIVSVLLYFIPKKNRVDNNT